MKKSILITATNTNVGKTTATIALINEFAKIGIKAAGFKPIETGVTDIAQDGMALLSATHLQNFKINDICPITYKLGAAPYVAKMSQQINWIQLKYAHNKLLNCADIVLIESAGGLMSPIEQGVFNIDLFEKFNCNKLLLICNSTLGCLSDAVVYSHAVKLSNIPYTICVNRREQDNFEELSLPFWIDYFGECLELKRNIKQIAEYLL